jgi:protein-tyrosine phosphatase
MHRKLNFPATNNTRDLGGYPTTTGTHTRWKSFVRSDRLNLLTPAGMQAVLEYGVRTIIDLRYPFEIARDPNPFAKRKTEARYIHYSLMGESWDDWMTREPAFGKAYWYPGVLDTCQRELREVLELMADAPAGGILFHCHVGKDRTGILAMLLLALAGVDADTIAADYNASFEHLRPDYEAYLGRTSDPLERASIVNGYRCPPEYAYEALAHLDQQYGGAERYVRHIGLGVGQMDKLRGRLI